MEIKKKTKEKKRFQKNSSEKTAKSDHQIGDREDGVSGRYNSKNKKVMKVSRKKGRSMRG